MAYEKCIDQLRVLLDATEPIDKPDAVQKFGAACALVARATQDNKKARDEFSVFLSYYEIFALNLPSSDAITKKVCGGELTRLIAHLPKE